MSRRLQSAATTNRLQSVAKVVDGSSFGLTLDKIVVWLKDNRPAADQLWKMIDSGIAEELLLKSQTKRLPRSCTRLSLLANALKVQWIKGQNESITKNVLKLMKAKDPKIVNKLFYYDLTDDGSLAMKGNMDVDLYKKQMKKRSALGGDKLSKLKVEDDGAVDESANGEFFFCMFTEDLEMRLPAKADYDDVTHIWHRGFNKAIPLQSFGIDTITPDWKFKNNLSLKKATATNGKRLNVELFSEFQTLYKDVFDLDARLQEAHSDYSNLFGKAVLENRKATADIATKAVDEAKACVKNMDAGSSKRRRLQI
jgi:hypothetical protein